MLFVTSKMQSLTGHEVPFVIAALLITMGTAGCAAHPNDIRAQDINAIQYDNYSCSDLSDEYRRVNTAIAGASGEQRSVRLYDIYGYVRPPFMPLGRMLGSDREAQIALLKGEQSATIRAAMTRGCLGATPIPLGAGG